MGLPKRSAENARRLRANEEKWGVTLVDAGWTLIPSTILERQQALGLDPVDLNILLQLARYWWQAGNPPRPAINTIALCVGRSQSSVQRRLKKMERDGLIEIEHRFDERHGGQTSSNYYFRGLIKAASPYAEETLEDRQRNREEAAAKRFRKAPRKKRTTDLKVVK
jgi:predicted transcriptional regulator